ncbi:MAG: hypothetical protein LJE85_03570 [Gammaproteobacteria bacterium]|nr:hypothetical protein [Gammaproteobacteria bacterium]
MKKYILAIKKRVSPGMTGEEPFMDRHSVERIVNKLGSESKGQNDVEVIRSVGVMMVLISDINRNPMRIMFPIANYASLSREQIDAAMERILNRSGCNVGLNVE